MKKHTVGISFLVMFALASIGFAWGTYQDPQASTQQQAVKRATAKVVSVDASRNAIEIKDQTGANVTMAVSPQAKITKDGKDVALTDIKADDTVSVEWEEVGGQMTAKSLTVVSGKSKKP